MDSRGEQLAGNSPNQGGYAASDFTYARRAADSLLRVGLWKGSQPPRILLRHGRPCLDHGLNF